jgi:hypothetical protein
MPDRRLGWRKDKRDPRDYVHRPKYEAVRIPPSVNLLKWTAPIRNQSKEGSCVGFGVAGGLSSVAKQLKLYKEWFSPRDVYNGARYLEGDMSQEGCEPRDAWSWVQQRGCLLEHFWPYVANQDSEVVPSDEFNVDRAQWPVVSYIRVDNGTAGLMSALAEGHFVSIGTPWFDEWMSPGCRGKLREVTVSDLVVGGHETYLYGYDSSLQMMLGCNSWGKYWGSLGRYQMPFSSFDVFKDFGGYDAHYGVVNWSS